MHKDVIFATFARNATRLVDCKHGEHWASLSQDTAYIELIDMSEGQMVDLNYSVLISDNGGFTYIEIDDHRPELTDFEWIIGPTPQKKKNILKDFCIIHSHFSYFIFSSIKQCYLVIITIVSSKYIIVHLPLLIGQTFQTAR